MMHRDPQKLPGTFWELGGGVLGPEELERGLLYRFSNVLLRCG